MFTLLIIFNIQSDGKGECITSYRILSTVPAKKHQEYYSEELSWLWCRIFHLYPSLLYNCLSGTAYRGEMEFVDVVLGLGFSWAAQGRGCTLGGNIPSSLFIVVTSNLMYHDSVGWPLSSQ